MEQFTILKNEMINYPDQETFLLEDSGRKIIYKEWLNYKGKVIDYQISSEDGTTIQDDELAQRIQNFLYDQGL